MKNIWVCGTCHSVNNGKERRCYTCHAPRSTVEMPEAAAAIRNAATAGAVRAMATATRSGARYRPTWPVAILVVPAILAATALSFLQVEAWSGVIAANGRFIDDPARVAAATTVTIEMVGAYAAALILWSIWIALVVGNVPALTGRWPSSGRLGAFLAPFIPFVGLKRPHSVVASVLAILSEDRVGPRLLALGWWAAVLATYFVPTIVVYAAGPGAGTLLTLSTALRIRLVLLVPAAVLAIAVVVFIELEQGAALRRRATAVLRAQSAAA
jgi:hypothetical protein